RTINLLTCVLLDWPQRNDRASSHIQGHRRQINRALNLATAVDSLFGPEVIPHATRQIELSRHGAFFSDWRDEDVTAPQVLVSASHCDRIVGIMQPECAHDWHSCLTTLVYRGVKIRHQTVAQFEIL